MAQPPTPHLAYTGKYALSIGWTVFLLSEVPVDFK
jgi:hypothetical protein